MCEFNITPTQVFWATAIAVVLFLAGLRIYVHIAELKRLKARRGALVDAKRVLDDARRDLDEKMRARSSAVFAREFGFEKVEKDGEK